MPSLQELKRAIEIAEQIEKLEQELQSILQDQSTPEQVPGENIHRGGPPAPAGGKKRGRKKKRVVSAEAREKMAAAQRARRAKEKRKK